MRVEYSPDQQLLYLHLRDGTVKDTIELEPDVLLDVDAAGEPLGIEFLDAATLLPFLSRLAIDAKGRTILDLPEGLIAAVKRSRQAAVA